MDQITHKGKVYNLVKLDTPLFYERWRDWHEDKPPVHVATHRLELVSSPKAGGLLMACGKIIDGGSARFPGLAKDRCTRCAAKVDYDAIYRQQMAKADLYRIEQATKKRVENTFLEFWRQIGSLIDDAVQEAIDAGETVTVKVSDLKDWLDNV